ncbi:hypothetical protein Tco_0808620 [Tanacetum coccineum]
MEILLEPTSNKLLVVRYLPRRVPPIAIQGYRVFTVARFPRYLPIRIPSSVIQSINNEDKSDDSDHGDDNDDSDKDSDIGEDQIVDFSILVHDKEPVQTQPEPQIHSPGVTTISQDDVSKQFIYFSSSSSGFI